MTCLQNGTWRSFSFRQGGVFFYEMGPVAVTGTVKIGIWHPPKNPFNNAGFSLYAQNRHSSGVSGCTSMCASIAITLVTL